MTQDTRSTFEEKLESILTDFAIDVQTFVLPENVIECIDEAKRAISDLIKSDVIGAEIDGELALLEKMDNYYKSGSIKLYEVDGFSMYVDTRIRDLLELKKAKGEK